MIRHVYPPIGGIGRKTGFQQQPPFQSYDSVNFWPVDVKTGRKISAMRPAFSPFTTLSGVATMMAPVAGTRANHPFNSFATAVDGKIYYWNGTNLVAATGAQAEAVDTDRMVFADTVINKLYIPVKTNKPIVFDYSSGAAATLSESKGTCPSDTRIAAQWQGALWLAGRLAEPNILFGSRVGDPTDWDASVGIDDQFGAFTSAADFDGVLGAPITALVPQHRDAMLVSTFNGTLIMRGHPRQGGIFEPLSTQYILGQGAWTMTPDNTVFFLSPSGLMQVPPQFGAVPVNISQGSVPDELLGLDYSYENPAITLQYEPRWNGIYIFDRNAGTTAWFYDLESGGFHRLETGLLVYAACDFPGGMTESTSSALIGHAGGLARVDRFGDEPRKATLVCGPVRLGDTIGERHLIQSMRVVFGRDTPAGDGAVSITTGIDGQDAVNRMLAGHTDFVVSLSTLEANSGLCHPRVAGVAAVVVFNTEDDLAFELIELETVPAGRSRGQRAPQLPVYGVPATISDFTDGFDAGAWKGYQGVTPPAPSEDLTDVTLFLDLSLMSEEWWLSVRPDGGDIRATNDGNTQLPIDLIYFDKVAKEGLLAVKCTQLASGATPIRVWSGAAAALPDPEDDFGQFNAYDQFWRGFWPNGAGNDRTTWENHTAINNATAGDVEGPIAGFTATDYTVDDQSYSWIEDFNDKNPDIFPGDTLTFVVAARYPDPSATFRTVMTLFTSSTHRHAIVGNKSDTNINAQMSSVTGGTTTTSDAAPSANWNHLAGVARGLASRSAILNGGTPSTNSTTASFTDVPDDLFIGAQSSLPNSNSNAEIALAQIHTTERSPAWCKYQYDMFNQPSFWDVETDYFVANPPPDEIVEGVACPTGIEPYAETGTWAGYASATVPAALDTFPGFTVLIDLADMPADWWSNVSATGVDIRATDSANFILASDLIAFDADAETGLLAVRLQPNDVAITTLRIWCGNASAVTVPPCSTKGQFAAYDPGWKAFWPFGGGNDRTINLNHLSLVSSGTLPVVGGSPGPCGGGATLYNAGTAVQGAWVEQLSADVEPPFTVITAGRLYGPTWLSRVYFPLPLIAADKHGAFFQGHGVAASIRAKIQMSRTVGFWSTVERFPAFRVDQVKSHGGIDLISDWWVASLGVAADGVTRPLQIGGLPEFTPGVAKYFEPSAVSAVRIGAIGVDPETGEPRLDEIGGLDKMPAYYALTGLRNDIVSQDWVDLFNDMLDQSTFWGAWSWTASSTSLTA